MRPQRIFVGEGQHPVVIVDDATGDPGAIVDLAAALAPFPPLANYYPGVRRVLGGADTAAMAYVEALLEALAPFLGGGFDLDRFDLIEASFSLVTTPPHALAPPQRAPHFDAADADYLAILHYLTPTAGTAFYRQRSTGIEAVTPSYEARFIAHAKGESAGLQGYTAGSNAAFEEIGRVEGLADRVVIYQGRVLHSGIIGPDERLSTDPRQGRLTANLFVQARR